MRQPSEQAVPLPEFNRTIKAVLFDGDGVVFDSERITNEAFCRILGRHGVRISVDEVDPYRGFDTKILLKKVHEDFGIIITPDQYVQARDHIYEAICREQDGPDLVSGIIPLIDWLDEQEIPYAMATGASQMKMVFNLTRTNTLHRFRTRVTSTEVANGKPAPDIYIEAAQRLGVESKDCIVIEDTLAGLQGARAAGAVAVGLVGTETNERLSSEADLVFESLHDIQGYLMSRM